MTAPQTAPKKATDPTFYHSFVPKTVAIPEEEFQALYASYVVERQSLGEEPLDFACFLGSCRISLL